MNHSRDRPGGGLAVAGRQHGCRTAVGECADLLTTTGMHARVIDQALLAKKWRMRGRLPARCYDDRSQKTAGTLLPGEQRRYGHQGSVRED